MTDINAEVLIDSPLKDGDHLGIRFTQKSTPPPPAPVPSGTLTVLPNPIHVSSGQTTGKATISWASQNAKEVGLYLDTGGKRTLIQAGGLGAISPDWIAVGTSRFVLCADGGRTDLAPPVDVIVIRDAPPPAPTPAFPVRPERGQRPWVLLRERDVATALTYRDKGVDGVHFRRLLGEVSSDLIARELDHAQAVGMPIQIALSVGSLPNPYRPEGGNLLGLQTLTPWGIPTGNWDVFVWDAFFKVMSPVKYHPYLKTGGVCAPVCWDDDAPIGYTGQVDGNSWYNKWMRLCDRIVDFLPPDVPFVIPVAAFDNRLRWWAMADWIDGGGDPLTRTVMPANLYFGEYGAAPLSTYQDLAYAQADMPAALGNARLAVGNYTLHYNGQSVPIKQVVEPKGGPFNGEVVQMLLNSVGFCHLQADYIDGGLWAPTV